MFHNLPRLSFPTLELNTALTKIRFRSLLISCDGKVCIMSVWGLLASLANCFACVRARVNVKKSKFLYSAASNPQECSKHFTLYFPTDLFNQTPSQLLWEASSRKLQLMREGCSYIIPPLSIASNSFIQLSELEQCRLKKLAQCFNTAAQHEPGSSEPLR